MAVIRLLVSLVAAFGAAVVGSAFTNPAIPVWYQTLKKPAFAPPNWLFGPAWTLLYILMALASWLVWQKGLATPQVGTALIVYLVQLVLNALWSVLFFGLRSPLAGLIEILLLWSTILVTTVLFFRISRAAGALLLPYLGWVSFATLLNAAILRLNP
ncbi:MAG: TspO/MBR family protein [candidate division WOR-3 bacterium]